MGDEGGRRGVAGESKHGSDNLTVDDKVSVSTARSLAEYDLSREEEVPRNGLPMALPLVVSKNVVERVLISSAYSGRTESANLALPMEAAVGTTGAWLHVGRERCSNVSHLTDQIVHAAHSGRRNRSAKQAQAADARLEKHKPTHRCVCPLFAMAL